MAPSHQKLVSIRTLYSTQYPSDWATFLNGGRHDRLLNVGKFMPAGCKVVGMLGILVDSTGKAEVGQIPRVSFDGAGHGFTIESKATQAHELGVLVHQWHDGLSSVRTRPVYDVEQPVGADCAIPGVLYEP